MGIGGLGTRSNRLQVGLVDSLGAIWDVKVINTRWIWQKATKRGNHAAQQEIESNKIKFVWKFEDSKSEKSCPCLRVFNLI